MPDAHYSFVGLHLLAEADEPSKRLRGTESRRRSRGIVMLALLISIYRMHLFEVHHTTLVQGVGRPSDTLIKRPVRMVRHMRKRQVMQCVPNLVMIFI